jgi:pentatricopeptide repeat protein
VAEVQAGLVSNQQLDMDTMRVTPMEQKKSDLLRTNGIDSEFNGLLVTSVVPSSPAGAAGVVAGDVLVAVSATIGDAIWPVTTLTAVQAALSSRKWASRAGSVTLELQRLGEAAANTGSCVVANNEATSALQYELTLTRPLGFSIGEAEDDGYVIVTAIRDGASNLVRHAVAVGDRIVAIDAALGSTLWPVSTVEGAISAVTGRIPGQAVTIRFERPTSTTKDAAAPSQATTTTAAAAAATTVTNVNNPAAVQPSQKELIQRCREVLKRYLSKDAMAASAASRNSAVVRMSAQVADKVVDALACASATIDSVTLSMIMNAYLQCRQASYAIRIFESATGFCGDGSSMPVKEVITGKTGGCIVPSESALNLYTGTALMKAHGEMGDYHSVVRVLAALEGRSGDVDEVGLESAPWPWTGTYGTIQPDTVCYNVAIAAAAKAGGRPSLTKALELFDRMTDNKSTRNKRPLRNEVTYNTLISALCSAGMAEKAFSTFAQMRRGGLRPDKFTYTSLLRVCVNESDLQELFYDMLESGAKPDVVTYNTMIKTLCQKRQLTQATKLVTEMEYRGISPDSRTYGALMNGLLQAGKPSACLTLFEAACSNSRTSALTDNVHLYTCAITAASTLGDHERALELVSRMTGNGVRPNLKTLTAVMGACLSSGKAELAAQLYRKMDRPDGYATRQGVRALCQSGDVASAVEILEAQPRTSRLLSGRQMMASYEDLLCAAVARHEYSLGRRIVQDLLGKGYIPSKQIFSALLGSLELDSRVVAAPEALAKFQFLLFVLDSLRQRHLPVESDLYLASIILGGQLGGLPRTIALLLTRAKSAMNAAKEEILSPSNSASTILARPVDGWVHLLENYDSYPKMSLTAERLPLLPLRVAPRDTLRVMRAEQAVSKNRPRSLS